MFLGLFYSQPLFQQVKPSDLGIYEVLMRIRHREANKKHPFGINLQVCSVLLEDENLGNRFVSFIIFKLWLTMFFNRSRKYQNDVTQTNLFQK